VVGVRRPAAGLAVLILASCTPGPARTTDGVAVVAAPTPQAAEAGIAVMLAGGNAVDAAVAVSFALGVTEPAMSGLGGQTQILVHPPDGPPVVINGTSYAPRATPRRAAAADIVGHRATTVPTTVRVLDHAWRAYGSGRVAWSDLLEPAVRYAEDGFVVGSFGASVWERYAEQLGAHAATRRLFLDGDGRAPVAGAVWRQPVLARTLRRLASDGAEEFYRGTLAREIARDMAEHRGWLTFDDLAGLPVPVEIEPLHGTYRRFDVYSLPPPGGGWVVLTMLNLLEQSPSSALRPGTPERAAAVARALRIGHRERRDHPVRNLVDYENDVAGKLDKATARTLLGEGDGQTTHFSVVDGDGLVVSVTQSINYAFGAKVASGRLGFLYNDYMREYELGRPDHPFALRAGAMPYSSMSPTIVVRDGKPVLALGSPGSARIISAVVQVAELWMDGYADVERAVAMPRLHVVPDSALYVEEPTDADRWRGMLASDGFVLVPRDGPAGHLDPYFGGVHAVALEGGTWTGAADPRRDGVVVRTQLATEGKQ